MTTDAPTKRWLFGFDKFQLVAFALLGLMAANLVSVTIKKSITADEVVLIPAAYYHWVADDVHLVGQHPPLSKLLAGFPLLFLQPQEAAPDQIDPAATGDNREWAYTMRFWQDNRPRFDAICFWSRIPMIALTIVLGIVVFAFARELFGGLGGVLAVGLFSLEPTILAHGRVVQTDMPAAFGFVLTLCLLDRYVRKPTWKHAAAVGAAAAIAMLAKYSMLFLGPLLLVLLVARVLTRRKEARATLVHAVVAFLALILVINAAYFFHHRALTERDLSWIAASFPAIGSFLSAGVRVFQWLLPTDFIMGVYWQLKHSKDGHPAGLLGMHGDHGWWYYFPVAFALKTTVPFLLLSLGGLGWAGWRAFRPAGARLFIVLAPLVIYTALMLITPINIGVRYYLPGYILLVLLAGGLLAELSRLRQGPMRMASVAVSVGLLSWVGVEAVRAYPNHMSYLNQFASSRPHWWYLSDSNVEWGDDVKLLGDWLRARGETRVRALLLGGFVTLDFYGVNYVDALSNSSPVPRYTALGASFLNGSTVPPYAVDGKPVADNIRVNTFDSYRHRKPEAIIGGSIYVYRDRD
ncbi:MAG TPA: glycosyltransferase family 39 protein [Chthoniobacterales bacterium]|nr:glycosyltransferase family 39 protein [Chthoniobacterales bacterium]